MSQDIRTSGVQEPKKETNVWLIVGIIAAIILLLLCCCVVILFVFPGALALLGPAVGNVFSNIIEEMVTPVP